MERQEELGGAACEGEPAAVVQRTQVLLLAGEPWGPDGGQRLLSSFQQAALPPTRDGTGPPGAQQPPTGPTPLPLAGPGAPPAGQLVFFLCRAGSLRERPERLREALQGVRDQGRAAAPAALVGILVQPRPDEEREALRHLEQLLRDVFLDAAAAAPGLELHTAVFAPGRPDGALELRRVKERLSAQGSVSNFRLDKMLMMQIFGAVLSFGTMAYGGYYLYNNPPV